MYFLGIDGGGTKTKVIIIDEKEKVLFENISGPSSLDTVSQETTVNNINQALAPFFEQNKSATFQSVFAGLGGVPDKKTEVVLTNLLKRINGVDKNTLLVGRSDMENALASGLLTDGIVLIVGTGMVAYGQKNGRTHRAGGLGYKEGDLGSGYDLGIRAIRACARSLDKRIQSSAFTEELCEFLGLKVSADVIELMDMLQTDRTKVASLAPYVTKHANLLDVEAMKICDEASYELALAVNAVYKELSFKAPTLVIVGTLGNVEGYYKKALHKHIRKFIPNINIIEPQVDPAFAAALLAKQKLIMLVKNN